MGAAYTSKEWSDLFVASAGASAALTGLLFVAVSVNIEHILEFSGLPERALQTLVLLLSVVVVSLIGLIPGQTTTALGVELLVTSVGFGAAISWLLTRTVPSAREHEPAVLHLAYILPGSLALVLGAASLIAGSGGGLYWIVAGIVGAILGASVNAWVLMVEILR